MKHYVMGTAGHVDHGKTALVQALTGINTDRLEEEKRRGMTIELGFAPMVLNNGETISIIDVPGHERFVKTMVAGIAGIDFALLVVAANEGVMPQTREHLQILKLLQIQAGIVVIAKCDLVEIDFLGLVIEDLKQELKNSPFKNAPIHCVSAIYGEGMKELRTEIEQTIQRVQKKKGPDVFRLFVDRAFIMQGHGMIAAGTISGGKISQGEKISILPQGKSGRVRSMQIHGALAKEAGTGQRCALNLIAVDKEGVRRGDVVTLPDTVETTTLVDAILYGIEGGGGIAHNQRVHLHVGTQEVLARIRMIGKDTIEAGESGYVQLRVEKPIVALRGDRFVVRMYSPVRTIGGGEILNHRVGNRARYAEESIGAMEIESQGEEKEVVLLVVKDWMTPFSEDQVWKVLYMEHKVLRDTLQDLVAEESLVLFEGIQKYIHVDRLQKWIKGIQQEFRTLYKQKPYQYWIDKEEIRSKVFFQHTEKETQAILQYLQENNMFYLRKNYIMEVGSNRVEDIFHLKEVIEIREALKEGGMNPKGMNQLAEDLRLPYEKVREIMGFLCSIEKAVALDNSVVISMELYQKALEKIRNLLIHQGKVDTGEVRDLLQGSRKGTIMLLEYLDHKGITKRMENNRYPGPNFDQ